MITFDKITIYLCRFGAVLGILFGTGQYAFGDPVKSTYPMLLAILAYIVSDRLERTVLKENDAIFQRKIQTSIKKSKISE